MESHWFGGGEPRGRISMCGVSFDLKIRGCFLEEVSVTLGLNGPAEMAFHPGQKLLWQPDVFRVHNDRNQKKPFPCIEHLLCAPAYTHVSLIMAEALQGKPSLLGRRGGIQTHPCQTPKSTLFPSHKLPLLWSSVLAQRQKKVEEQRLRQKWKLELYIYIHTHTHNIYIY